jgi:hypothetical protein
LKNNENLNIAIVMVGASFQKETTSEPKYCINIAVFKPILNYLSSQCGITQHVLIWNF